MKHLKWKELLFNLCIALNCLLLFVLLFSQSIEVPAFLAVFGRAHPLVLHFPIVLLLLAFLFELIISSPKQSSLKNTADWLLLAAAFTTVVAALMGLFLSKEEGYGGNDIDAHKWTGIACALISISWYGFRKVIRKYKVATAVTGACSTVVLLIAGHKGAGITHGNNFLLSPFMAANTEPLVSVEDAIIYTHLIKPILDEKCVSCHNSNKAKGDLIMESEQSLLKGGKNGKLWDSSATAFGLMMQRIHLPEGHKEHMPPKGKPQLTEEEIQILYLWIKRGADFTKKLAGLSDKDSLRMLAEPFFDAGELEVYDFAAADERTISELNNEYRVITPLASESPALSVNFFSVAQFNSEQLNDLSKIKNNIVSLHLAKMPVKDEDLKVIGTFNNLRELNLAFSTIKGDGLKYLGGLQHLKKISLSGINISSAQLKPLMQLKELRSVKVWNTAIAEKDVASLKAKFPKTDFDIGYKGDTVIARLTPPVIDADKKIFKNNLAVVIKSPVPGSVVRYTLDGTDPDSISSPVYKQPVVIDQSVVITAKSFLPGWISSDIASSGFYKTGIKPDSIALVTMPVNIQNAKNGKALLDEELGTVNQVGPAWIGYRNNSFEALLFFNTPAKVSSVTLNTLVFTVYKFLPPGEIEIWGGNNAQSLKLLGKSAPVQPAITDTNYVASATCAFPGERVSVIKIIAKRSNWLPPINDSKKRKPKNKAENNVLYIDELFVN